jgi:hypothetical protein
MQTAANPSLLKFPLTGKNTGNLSLFAPSLAHRYGYLPHSIRLSRKETCGQRETEQGIIWSKQGFTTLVTGNDFTFEIVDHSRFRTRTPMLSYS